MLLFLSIYGGPTFCETEIPILFRRLSNTASASLLAQKRKKYFRKILLFLICDQLAESQSYAHSYYLENSWEGEWERERGRPKGEKPLVLGRQNLRMNWLGKLSTVERTRGLRKEGSFRICCVESICVCEWVSWREREASYTEIVGEREREREREREANYGESECVNEKERERGTYLG